MNPVLPSIKPVIENATYVNIDGCAIDAFCASMDLMKNHSWNSAAPFQFSRGDAEAEVAFTLAFNAINYCYWQTPKWAIEYQGKRLDGSWAMMGSLRRAIQEGTPILDPSYLSTLTVKDASIIFRGHNPLPLFEERVECLRELGRVVNEKYAGRVTNVIASADHNALRLLDILTTDFPHYDDRSTYAGKPVFFHKRAQLAISDIHELFNRKDLGEFSNISELTAFADYKIPQLLRGLGILRYASSLASTIDAQQELPSGSIEEIEIRASTIQAVELMRLRIPGQPTAAEIDHQLWLASQRQQSLPYHRTRTIGY